MKFDTRSVLFAVGIVALLAGTASAQKVRHVAHVDRRPIYDVAPGYGKQTGTDSNAPAATGGGSLGYNQNLYNW
jgi:hypothetical protein